ncbi:hypothetical protein BJ508DRAFT_312402 [Ascobolus immersus RN42]|uniref:Uncharacterized protein n=1 Tax=Ascobolus immersus RN42 TaxID=1160509 RepID=A0A3N4HZ89_ASCIM|nr:hypothetical protein BJ508DRAFT_312402 [Ascobolus immersus RN42]
MANVPEDPTARKRQASRDLTPDAEHPLKHNRQQTNDSAPIPEAAMRLAASATRSASPNTEIENEGIHRANNLPKSLFLAAVEMAKTGIYNPVLPSSLKEGERYRGISYRRGNSSTAY